MNKSARIFERLRKPQRIAFFEPESTAQRVIACELFPAFSGSHDHLDFQPSWRGRYKDLAIICTRGIYSVTIKKTSHKDSEGIFCGSYLTRHIDESREIISDIQEWREVSKPLGSFGHNKKTADLE